MGKFKSLLDKGDLRTIGKSNSVVAMVHSQSDFDELFRLLFVADRALAMRAADAIEKITTGKHSYLKPHRSQVLNLLARTRDKEMKWHVAQLITRVELTALQKEKVWNKLSAWVMDPRESKIVRVNALEALYILSESQEKLAPRLSRIVADLSIENIPSIAARIGKLGLAGK